MEFPSIRLSSEPPAQSFVARLAAKTPLAFFVIAYVVSQAIYSGCGRLYGFIVLLLLSPLLLVPRLRRYGTVPLIAAMAGFSAPYPTPLTLPAQRGTLQISALVVKPVQRRVTQQAALVLDVFQAIPILDKAVTDSVSPRPFIEEDSSIKGQLTCLAPALPWKNSSRILQGHVITARIRVWRRPSRFLDFLNPLATIGCRLIATTRGSPLVSEDYFSKLRRRNAQRIRQILGVNDTTELLLGMTIGYRDQLGENTYEAFRDLALLHLVVLSGLQISLVFFTLEKVLIWFGVPSIVSLLVPFFSVCGFVLYAGVEPSALRAVVALAYITVGRLLDRPASGIQSLAVAVLAIAAWWPLSIFTPGVQLTVAALLSLGLAMRVPLRSRLIKGIVASVLCTITTSCVGVWWFDRWSPYGWFFSPLFTPLFSMVICYLSMPAAVGFLSGADSSGILLKVSWSCIWWLQEAVFVLAPHTVPSAGISFLGKVEITMFTGAVIMIVVFLQTRKFA